MTIIGLFFYDEKFPMRCALSKQQHLFLGLDCFRRATTRFVELFPLLIEGNDDSKKLLVLHGDDSMLMTSLPQVRCASSKTKWLL